MPATALYRRAGLMALLISACAHTESATPGQPAPGEILDVSPGRDPEQVRAELRRNLDGMVSVGITTEAQVPPEADPRVRLVFRIAPDGGVVTEERQPANHAAESASAVLQTPLAIAYLSRFAHFPAAPLEVTVRYEFRAPSDWPQRRAVARERMEAARHTVCEAMALSGDAQQGRLRTLAADRTLPITAENVFRLQVGTFAEAVLNISPEDRQGILAQALCELGDHRPPEACPALAAWFSRLADCNLAATAR